MPELFAEYPEGQGCVEIRHTPDGYICYFEGDELPERATIPSVPTPHWGEFRTGMFYDSGFQHFMGTLRSLNPALVDGIQLPTLVEPVEIPFLVQNWNMAWTLVPLGMLDPYVPNWRAIAQSASVPISWSDQGIMELLQ